MQFESTNKSELEELPSEKANLTDVKSEQIRIIFEAIPQSLFAILIVSTILSTVQWDIIDHQIIVIWLLFTNGISLLRLHFYHRFKRLDERQIVDHNWYQVILVTSGLSGACWGAAGIWLFSQSNVDHQMFLVFVVAGMCAGSITTLSADLKAAAVFLILALVPIIIQFLLIDTGFSIAMELMTILFLVMLLISAKRLSDTILESLNIRNRHEVAEQTIRYQALYDDLTKLPNRRLYLLSLKREMARSSRHNRYGAVFFIDLDRFKSINDSLGHRIGDELLIVAAERIKIRLREEDSAARFGGDEFVVLIADLGSDSELASHQATRIANDIRQLFELPLIVQDHELHLSISIGVSLFPQLDSSAEELIQFADIAMYYAKNAGRNKVRLFSQEMQDAVDQRRIIEKGLRGALENNEFELYFQPQFDSKNTLVGAESLLRWNHPDKGLLTPGLFIVTAEQTGLIEPIGDWILWAACEHLATLADRPNLTISVNVSPRQFRSRKFVDKVQSILSQTGANPRQLKLEITEGMVIDDIEKTIATMNTLKSVGISFSVDDFGTGYSSLAYLNKLPVDELKIDQSFVRNISNSSENAVIVDTIIAMAKHLNLNIIAEGVETCEEFDYLRENDCRIFQGFFFGKPEPFKHLLNFTN